jgi:hypothetical protein
MGQFVKYTSFQFNGTVLDFFSFVAMIDLLWCFEIIQFIYHSKQFVLAKTKSMMCLGANRNRAAHAPFVFENRLP